MPDDNFHLTVLQSLWNEGLMTPFDKPGFYNSLGETWDPDADYNDEVDERVRKALLAIDLPTDKLERLKTISWDGGDDVHHLVISNWYGEDGAFDVTNVSGIEACSNVTTLKFIAGFKATDLSPISKLHKLVNVKLRGPQYIDDVTPLRHLSALRTVDVVAADNATNRAVLDELRGRGVAVEV